MPTVYLQTLQDVKKHSKVNNEEEKLISDGGTYNGATEGYIAAR